MRQVEELLESDETFLTLDSLDEEEADSDESGYVEAPPKSLLSQEDTKDSSLEKYDVAIDHVTEAPEKNPPIINDDLFDRSRIENNPKEDQQQQQQQQDTEEAPNNNQKFKDREKVDFIKCPISETIKKLANASLRSSKSLEISTNNCLKALNNLKSSKSFDGSRTIDHDEESPSLHQRKQLLAQQGVTV